MSTQLVVAYRVPSDGLKLKPQKETHLTREPKSTPSSVPVTSERIELSAETIGFTLKTDEKTLIEIDEIHEMAIKAAQAMKKFALR